MRILIFGGGIHAHRYVESLLWTEHEVHICGLNVLGKSEYLSDIYRLPYILFDDLDSYTINNYDLLIVGIALVGKYKIIERLINHLNYKNSIIIDKPLSIDRAEIERYKNLLEPLNSYAVVCQRDFNDLYYKIPIRRSYNITWYSLTEDLLENIVDRMPHLLSWLMQEIGDDIHLEVCDNYLRGAIENSMLEIHFIKSDVCGVEINNMWYKSPDYRWYNSKIVEEVYHFNKEDSMKNFNRALAVSSIMCDLLEML